MPIPPELVPLLESSAVAFVLLLTGTPVLRRSGTIVLLLFCVVLLIGGVLSLGLLLATGVRALFYLVNKSRM